MAVDGLGSPVDQIAWSAAARYMLDDDLPCEASFRQTPPR